MGEIAEMMLDGTLCEGCGVALGGSADGFPRQCSDCAREVRAEKHAQTLTHHQQIKKTPCPTCGRAQNISDVPKTEEEIAKLLARKAKVDAKVAKLAGISVVAV